MKGARLQHHVSLRVREYLDRHGLHQYDVKDELGEGWGEGKVSRLLSGRATMSLSDMYALLDMCGQSLTEFVSSLAGEELPSTVRRAVIAEYLHDQLQTVKAESADTE